MEGAPRIKETIYRFSNNQMIRGVTEKWLGS